MNFATMLSRLLTALLFTSLCASLGATTYYVSSIHPARDDSNPGTSPDAPWATIARVNAEGLGAGDTVLFERGSVWREKLAPTAFGEEGLPVILAPYGTGEKPTILGSEQFPWTLHGGTVYTTTTPVETFYIADGDSKVAFLNAIIIGNNPSNLPPGFFTKIGGAVYANLGRDPNGIAELAQRDIGIELNASRFVTLDGLRVRVTNSAGILVEGTNGVIVQNCETFLNGSQTRDGAGIHMGGTRNTIIQNNVVREAHGDGIFAFNCPDTDILNNVVYTVFRGKNTGGDCIQFTGPRDTLTSGRFSAVGNWMTMEGTDTGKGCMQVEHFTSGYVAENVALFGNFGIDSGGPANLIIENNFVAFQGFGDRGEPFAAGILMEEGDRPYDNITIRNNVIYQTRYAAMYLWQSAPKTNFTIVNNTMYDTGNGVRFQSPMSGELKNNIMWVKNRNATLTSSYQPSAPPLGDTWDVDYNIIGDPNDPNFAINFLGTFYTDFATYQAVTGYDANSITVDPELVDPDNTTISIEAPIMVENFALSASSPAIDAGVYIGLMEDYFGNVVPQGNGVDMGAIESPFAVGTPVSPPAAPSGLVAEATAKDTVRLLWDAAPGPVEVIGYNLYRSEDPAFVPSAATRIASLVTDLVYFDLGLLSETSYTYKIQSVGLSGLESTPLSGGTTTLASAAGAIAYEGFEDGLGALDGAGRGEGWGAPWDASEALFARVQSPSVSYPDYEASGARAVLRGEAERLLRDPIAETSGDLWLFAILRSTSSSEVATLSLVDGTTPVLSFSHKPLFAFRVNGVDTGLASPVGETLVLTKVTFAPGGNAVRVWLNPDISGGAPSDASADYAFTDLANWGLDRVRLSYPEDPIQSGEFDEIILASTFTRLFERDLPDTVPPLAPTILSATALDKFTIQFLAEESPDPDFAYFQLFRGTTPGFTPATANLAGNLITDTVFIDPKVPVPGDTYYYKLAAVDTSGNVSAASAPVAGASIPVTGTLLVYEGFDYPTGSDALNGAEGGESFPSFGWSGSWSTTVSGWGRIFGSSYTFEGLETHGGRASIRGTATRDLAQTIGGDSSTVWMGMALRCSNSSRKGQFQFVNNGVVEFFVEHRPNNNVLIAGVNSGVPSTSGSRFIVLRVDFDPAGATLYGWVDPELTETELDIATADVTRNFTSNIQFDQVRLNHSSTQSHSSDFDELRIGTSYVDAFQGTGPDTVIPNERPTAVLEASETIVVSGTAIDFTALNSTDPDGFIAQYAWTFGNGQTSDQPSASVVFDTQGSSARLFPVQVTVTDDSGDSDSANVLVTAYRDRAPTPAISVTPDPGGATVTVTITVPGGITPQIFYTLDGSIPTNASTFYTGPFSIGADLTVRAIATDLGKATSLVASRTIAIDLSGESVFTADADGLIIIEAEDYHTKFDKPGEDIWTETTDAAGFSGTGAMFFGPDGNGGDGSDFQGSRMDYRVLFPETGRYYIWVRGQALVGLQNTTDSVHAGLNNQEQPESDAIAEFLEGVWTWSNARFQSLASRYIDVSSLEPEIFNVFGREDGFTIDKIILTTDPSFVPTDSGPVSIAQETFTSIPPQAVALAAPQNAGVGETVSFDGTTSEDLDGTIVSYSWDFDDGSPTNPASMPSYSFGAPGIYGVTLTVMDDSGLEDTATVEVVVAGASPYESWAGGFAWANPGVDDLPEANPEGDPLSNEREFFHNTNNPLGDNNGAQVRAFRDGNEFVFQFRRNPDAASYPKALYRSEGDLGNLIEVTGFTETVVSTELDGTEWVEIRLPIGPSDRAVYQLRIGTEILD